MVLNLLIIVDILSPTAVSVAKPYPVEVNHLSIRSITKKTNHLRIRSFCLKFRAVEQIEYLVFFISFKIEVLELSVWRDLDL